MKKYLFIVNPIAGKGKTLELIPKIKESFNRDSIYYEILITENRGHGEKIAHEGVEKGFTHIISVGGDGTANEVVNGIKDRDVVLGVVPSGTGNDFVRMIGMPKDCETILEVIKNAKTKQIDVGSINNRYFLNFSSVGMDAEVVKETENIKKYISGTTAYILGIFKALIRYKNKEVEVLIDGKKYNRRIELIAVGNGQYYGGGLKINPKANINDGLLDICLVNKMNKFKFASLFLTAFKGNHVNIKEVEVFRGKEVKIASKEELPLNIDGEIVGTTPAEIRLEKTSVNIIIPEEL